MYEKCVTGEMIDDRQLIRSSRHGERKIVRLLMSEEIDAEKKEARTQQFFFSSFVKTSRKLFKLSCTITAMMLQICFRLVIHFTRFHFDFQVRQRQEDA